MSSILVKTLTVGQVQTNCYLISNQETKEAVLVDPGDHASFLMQKCSDEGLTVTAILLTHGHFDHISAVPEIKEKLGTVIYAGEKEANMLQDPVLNLTWSYLNQRISIVPERLLKDGEEFELIGRKWQLIETPGHTAGSVCYWMKEEDILISGDTLFLESLGRSDLPTGSTAAIVDSITRKLFALPDKTTVYPGHGEPTTIAHEKQHNPVARYYKG